MKLVEYRPADNPEFIDQVVDALLAESPELKGIEVERRTVRVMLERSPAIKCLIYVQDGELLAAVILNVGPIWYSPKCKGARDLLVWVAPAWRNLGGALIDATEEWAKRNEVDELFLSQSTGIGVERTAALYESKGFTLSGFISHKRINHVHRT